MSGVILGENEGIPKLKITCLYWGAQANIILTELLLHTGWLVMYKYDPFLNVITLSIKPISRISGAEVGGGPCSKSKLIRTNYRPIESKTLHVTPPQMPHKSLNPADQLRTICPVYAIFRAYLLMLSQSRKSDHCQSGCAALTHKNLTDKASWCIGPSACIPHKPWNGNGNSHLKHVSDCPEEETLIGFGPAYQQREHNC